MSHVTEPAHASLAKAKAALIDAAKAIDPLAPMRSRPFVSVGVAAGVGVVLGMNRERLLASVRVRRAISAFVRLVALAVERYAVAKTSHSGTEMHQEPAPTPSPI